MEFISRALSTSPHSIHIDTWQFPVPFFKTNQAARSTGYLMILERSQSKSFIIVKLRPFW